MMKTNKKYHNHSATWEYCYDCVACTSGEKFVYDGSEEIFMNGSNLSLPYQSNALANLKSFDSPIHNLNKGDN